jgi:hypothetical protein
MRNRKNKINGIQPYKPADNNYPEMIHGFIAVMVAVNNCPVTIS